MSATPLTSGLRRLVLILLCAVFSPQLVAQRNACLPCHTNLKGHGFLPERIADLNLFLETEKLKKWESTDMHARAFLSIIESPVGQQMCRSLGISVTRKDIVAARTVNELLKSKKATALRNCIGCHSSAQPTSTTADLIGGVNCQACHGEATGGYYLAHQRNEWRTLKPAQKAAKGMIDIRDPATAAAKCANCHVGSLSPKGTLSRFVTHEMYAAGHPPLGNFELATFLERLPPHWKPFEQKGDFRDRRIYEYRNPAAAQTSYRRTTQVIHGAAASWQAWMTVTSGQTDRWPQLASFDCFSCHHELRSKRRRAVGRPPGRPHLPVWQTKLSLLTLQDGLATSKERELKSLFESVSVTPFGKAESVHRSCQALARMSPDSTTSFADGVRDELKRLWPNYSEMQFLSGQDADKQLVVKERLKAQQRTKELAANLLKQLVDVGADSHLDFYSARQLTWALNHVSADHVPKTETSYWKQLARLNEGMSFSYNTGSSHFSYELDSPNRYPISTNLTRSMKKIYDFDAALFQKKMKSVKSSLPATLSGQSR